MWGDHEYTGGCSVHWGFHANSVVFPITFPHIYHDIPRCTHDIPRCTEHPPLYCTPSVYCKTLRRVVVLLQKNGLPETFVHGGTLCLLAVVTDKKLYRVDIWVMQVSISSKTILHQNKPPGHDLKGTKTFHPGQSLCTKTLPSGQNRESKAPPPGHKARKFHKYIYKL